MAQELFSRAATAVGTLSALAKTLHISPQAIGKWKKRGRVPAERVLAFSRATGIPAYEIRPDLYPLEAALSAVEPQYREQVAETLGIAQQQGGGTRRGQVNG